MKNYDIQFVLSYSGADAEAHEIDLYDVSQALIGFQRSLAITTHLILNDEVITQSPSLKGAQIYAFPAEEGSWRIKAGILVLGTAAYHVATAPNNTPLGHLVFSAYDYVISQSLGFHVDYNKSLGQLYEEHRPQKANLPVIRESQLDAVVEKCAVAITEMHRPIFKTQTADRANIFAEAYNGGPQIPLQATFSMDSFQYIIEEYVEEGSIPIRGFVSSYNSNTFKGRIFVPEEGRPISFLLEKSAQNEGSIQLIVESLRANALRGYNAEPSEIYCIAKRVTTRSGSLKSYTIFAVSDSAFTE